MADEEDIPLALRLRKKAQVEYAPAPKYVEPSKKASKEYKRNDKKAQSRLHSQVEQLVANKEKKKHSAHSKSAISDLRSLYDKNVRPYLGAIAFGVLTLLFFYLRIREEFYDHDRALALMQEGDDPFTVLEVGKNASFPEIRSSYLELSKKFHPDKNPNCTDCGTKFEQIRLAYQKLSDPKKREQLVQGTTDSSASGDKEDSPIPSETFSLTDTNFDWEVQKQDAWLIQVYTDWSSACWEVMSDWEKTYTEIGKYIPMGRINTAKESELSRRFSIYKVPTFLSYVNGKHTVFHGRPNSSNFTAFMLNSLRESVWRITDANYRIFFNENEDKVRVLLFANRDLAKLRLVFRSLARTYKNSMVMGEVSALDSPGLYQLYNATKDKPSLVFIKEKGVKPLRYNGQMTYTKLKSLFDEHKFQVVPRLSTANVDDLCARPDNTSCVIFFKDAAPEDKRQEIMNALRNASRSAADATVDHEEGGAVETHPFFVWTDIAKQQQLASLLNVSAGSDRYIVALDKNNMKALAYPGDSADSSELLLWAQSLKDDADHFKPLSGALYLTYEAPPINFRQVWRTVSPYITSFLVVIVIVLLWYAAYTYYLDAKESKLAESRARRITKTKASLGQKDVKAEKWRAIEEENRKQEERRQKERAEQEKFEAEKRQQQARAAAAAAAAEAKLNPSAPVFQPSTVNAAATAAAAAVKAPKAEKKKEEKKKEEPKKKEEKKKEEQPKKKEATPAPAAAAAAPAAPAPPTDNQLRHAIEKAVNEADLETAKRSTIRDAVAKAFAGADLSARHAWIGTQIDAAFARRLE